MRCRSIRVTAGGELRKLVEGRYFVMHAEPEIDQEGTYPLPEAQPRPLFLQDHRRLSVCRRVERGAFGTPPAREQRWNECSAAGVAGFDETGAQVPVASHVKDYAVRLVLATHPKTGDGRADANQYLRFGSSPPRRPDVVAGGKGPRSHRRAASNVSFDDIEAVTAAGCAIASSNSELKPRPSTTDHIIGQILRTCPEDAAAVSVGNPHRDREATAKQGR